MCCIPEILFPGTQPRSSVSMAAGPVLLFQTRLRSWVTLGNGLVLLKPLFPHLQSGVII